MKQRLVLIPVLTLAALACTGCASLKSLTVSPGTVTLTSAGQTVQFKAVGTYQTGSAPTTAGDATKSVNWSSALPEVATVNSAGLATAVGNGTTTITADSGGTTATATLTVAIAATTTPDTVLTVIPATGLAVSNHVGDTTQFVAYGNLVGGGVLQDLTSRTTWISSSPGVATIDANGVATSKGVGKTIITAAYNGKTVTTDLTVATTGNLTPVLTIIPAAGAAAATHVGETTQFLAIGALGGSANLQDLTSSVRWVSSDVGVATVNSAGLATAVAVSGSYSQTTITAIATTVTGSTLTQTSTLTVAPSTTAVQIPTLSLYEVGSGTGTVTSSPAGVNCNAKSAANCTGNFTLGTLVTLTAVPDSGSTFAGWSANCTPATPNTPASPNPTCTVTMSNNTSVGAIFNK